MSFRINQVSRSRFHSDAKTKLRLRNLKSLAIAALGTGASVASTQLPDLLHQVSHWTTLNRMLVPYLFLQGSVISSIGLLGALKRTQSLKDVYSQINREQAGKLNEPIKIAFIDSGIDRGKIPEGIPLESCDQRGNSIDHEEIP